ncbi:hypothetical protein [Patiriisocius hiemis]|uniref:DUF5678 domain-containing protein n=1 Tax=Patiriisocius hiemis TaxID=3075604 RepID=A0ABU2YDZ4_9FLAO|nr:hypothetical protein [Constantimarinum sp. W242]MDT0556414.1 hypothetical protein [Constantimarinum sp. W242]
MVEENKNKVVLYTYIAKDLKTDKILAQGTKIEEVDKIAEASGREYILSFVPSSKYSFVF